MNPEELAYIIEETLDGTSVASGIDVYIKALVTPYDPTVVYLVSSSFNGGPHRKFTITIKEVGA